MYIQTSNQEKLKLGIGSYSCNWGIHIAGLYETEEERDEILTGFLCEGLVAGDMQLYCPAEQTEDAFSEKMLEECASCQSKLHDHDHFVFDSAKELYYPDGTFSPFAMDEGLDRFYEESQKKGKRNIRATAEMVWALKSIPGIEHLMAYEARLNYFIPDKPWISICLYNTKKFSGSIIMNVLKTHPYTISGGVLMQNPYFEDPAKWLAKNAPQFLKK
ncbi:MAG TPA: MEDS domain-containing protein [Bacteroidales bacterium]|nr:MEDS domain-containing protein [Bacteroidales bacterium]